MADTKITALTAISTVDPAVDVLAIVDVSDTTMAASGTTKKITSNQLLGAGGTATLASATISGDLTVDTSTLKVDTTLNRVGINTASPGYTLQVLGTSGSVADLCGSGVAGQQTLLRLRTATGNSNGLLIQGNFSNDEIFFNNFYNAALVFGVNNTPQMTLNSTGLGVNVTPVAAKLQVGLSAVIFLFTPERPMNSSGNSACRYILAPSFNIPPELVVRAISHGVALFLYLWA